MTLRPHVLVIDVGLGNIGSVVSALHRLNVGVERIKSPPKSSSVTNSSHVVLPGVGSFAKGMQALESTGWKDWIINYWCANSKPFLGICLGMQLMGTFGYEGTEGEPVRGLNLIPGHVQKLSLPMKFLLPHIGWNNVNWVGQSSTLSASIPQGADFYFVHSYAFHADSSSHVLAQTDYGVDFPSVIGSANSFGAQFHPEKSQKIGKLFLSNFLQVSC